MSWRFRSQRHEVPRGVVVHTVVGSKGARLPAVLAVLAICIRTKNAPCIMAWSAPIAGSAARPGNFDAVDIVVPRPPAARSRIERSRVQRHAVHKELADEPPLVHVDKVGSLRGNVAGVVDASVPLPRRLVSRAGAMIFHLEDRHAPRLIVTALLVGARTWTLARAARCSCGPTRATPGRPPQSGRPRWCSPCGTDRR